MRYSFVKQRTGLAGLTILLSSPWLRAGWRGERSRVELGQPLKQVIADIRRHSGLAARLDRAAVEQDIKARWHEAEAGRRWAMARDRLMREYKKRGLNEERGTQETFGRSVVTMRRWVQLHRNWTEYVKKRRAEQNGEYRGLLHAVSLVPVNRRYATNSQSVRVRSATSETRIDTQTLDLSWADLRTGDALEVLKSVPTGSIQCIITSPPFWPLKRSFGGMGLGFEKSFDEYLTDLLAIFHELWRVLADDGIAWLHLEDSHSHTGGLWRPDSNVTWRTTRQKPLVSAGIRMPSTTAMRPAKSLLLIPSLVEVALADQGWLVRSEIIWDKGFGRPDSAPDRPTVTHAKIFQLTKQQRYNYDADPLRVPTRPRHRKLNWMPKRPFSRPGVQKPGILRKNVMRDTRVYQNPLGRNSGTVWRYNVAHYGGEHTATLPLSLVRQMVLASCTHPDHRVLDPFGGAGSVAIGALQCSFHAISIDIHAGYTAEARERISRSPVLWTDQDGDAANDNSPDQPRVETDVPPAAD